MTMPSLISPSFDPVLNQKMGALQLLKLNQIPGAISDASITYSTQNANTILAAPDGSAAIAKGVPSFRALVAADIPNLAFSKITMGTSLVALANGGTGSNLSGTGGAGQVLQQSSAGAAITVGSLSASTLTNGVTGSGAVVLSTLPSIIGLTITTGGILISSGGIDIGTSTTTTAPGAGGAGALPATPAGYATILFNGISRKVAFY